ncbi:MAG TPA: ClpX C4-type zinc finger protein [Niallia sp.]|nr:ClpX C4-type zinc finger protein [Niallia sp.]
MNQEFRKMDDVILELEKLSFLCEEKSKNNNQLERQRFYEGMAIAYTTIAVYLKEDLDIIEPKVVDELYSALEKTSNPNSISNKNHVTTCSFCHKNKEEVGGLAMGPGVSICCECLEFGAEIIKSYSSDE